MTLPRGSNFAPTRITLRTVAGGGTAGTAPAPAQAASASHSVSRSARRDTELDDSITNLKEGKKLYSQSVDLPNVGANTTANADFTTAGQTCEQGDYIEFIGGEIANHGYIVLGCLPCPSNDTIRLRVANVTAGAINPTATTLYFVIHKFVSTQ